MNGHFYKIWVRQTNNLRKVLSAMLFNIHPAFLFSFLLLLTLFWGSFLPPLKFNYNIESFFSSEDPEVEFYYQHKDTFENENDFVLVGLKNNEGIFQKEFLQKTDTLTKTLKQFARVEKVFSPTNLFETIKTPLGGIRIPLIHVDEPNKYASDKSRIYTSGIYTNSFFADDEQAVSMLIRKQENLTRQVNDSLLLALKTTISSFGFDEFHIAGRIQTQHYYITKMKKQMGLFAGLACLLFLISLYLIFRNMRYVFLSFGAILVSLVWIFGFIGWMGVKLDLMLTLLPSLIFIISTSSSIHLITRFRNEFNMDTSKQNAIKKAVIETGLPNFLNAFTTAIGFASLIMIPVAPIQRFGLFSAGGILISFFIGLLFIPTALKVLNLKPSVKSIRSSYNDNGLFQKTLKKPRLIIGIASFFIIFGIFFSFQIKINNHFLDDLNPSSDLKNDLDFFEQNFSGIRPFEMNIQAKDGKSILTYNALSEMDKLETYLSTEYKAGFLFSPLNLIKSINKAVNGGSDEYYRIPASQEELDEVLKLAEKQRIWKRFLPVLNKDHSIGRISGRTKDEGSLVFQKRNENLETFIIEHTHHLKLKLTGAAYLMDNANSHIAWNLAKGMILAVLIATLVIGLFTSSWKLALISLVPNTLPLLLVAGFMGATGIPLKVTTALIFTIAYGIAVDDTIHFLNSYRLNKKIFLDRNEALLQTIIKMWRPMLYTSLVLFSGFMIFTLSEFSSISTLGVLVSSSLVVALLADLLFLPALLKTKDIHNP